PAHVRGSRPQPSSARAPPQRRHGGKRTRGAPEMEENLLEVAAPGSESHRPARQFLVAGSWARHELARGTADPSVDGIGLEPVEAEEEHAVGDLGPHAGKRDQLVPRLLERRRAEPRPERVRILRDAPRGAEQIGSAKADPRAPEIRLSRPRDGERIGKRAPLGPRDLRPVPRCGRLDVGADLADVRRGGADERREGFPRILAEEPEPEERHEARDGPELAGPVYVPFRILVQTEVVPEVGGI